MKFALFYLPYFLCVIDSVDRLHVACGVGASTKIVLHLLKAFPESSVVKTNKVLSLIHN